MDIPRGAEALRFSTITPAVVKCHGKRSLSIRNVYLSLLREEEEEEEGEGGQYRSSLLQKKEKMDDTIRNGHFSIA